MLKLRPLLQTAKVFLAVHIIFLDVEEGGRLPSTYFTYLKLWGLRALSPRLARRHLLFLHPD